MCKRKELAALLLEAKRAFHPHKVPPPPWTIEERPATWPTAWQVVDIELSASPSGGTQYFELRGYLNGLLVGVRYAAE
jgi:hypothetical protein